MRGYVFRRDIGRRSLRRLADLAGAGGYVPPTMELVTAFGVPVTYFGEPVYVLL